LSVILIVISLVAAACGGGDRGDDPSGVGSPTTAEASSGASDGSFGTLDSPCGEGDAKGATDQGVTDTEIRIGYGDDSGYPQSPGLNHQVSDAVKAFIAWCNDQGGINGREVVGDYYDAAVTNVANVLTEACEKDFYLVGEFWVLDDAQEPLRRGCGLPAVPAAAGTAKFANAPLKHEPVPSALDQASVSGAVQLQELYPDEVKKAGVLWGNYPVIVDRKDQVNEAYSEFGWSFDSECSVSYSITGEADWKPLIQKLKDCGAEVVYWVGSPAPNFEAALEAASQLEYEPVWWSDTNTYDLAFAKWNTNGFGDKVYFRMAFTPLEEADSNPAVEQYLQILEDSGGDVNQFGEQAASAFLLWATAVQACGSDVTRDCVAGELDDVHEWTGGGLHAPTDPGANTVPSCGVLMNLKGTEFVRVTPEEADTYDCDPSYAHQLEGLVVTRNNIGPDRIAPL
jgi:hypothetical protein